MDKEKILVLIWSCFTVVFVTVFLVSGIFKAIQVWRVTDGTTISLDLGSLTLFALVIAVYYLSKFLIRGAIKEEIGRW